MLKLSCVCYFDCLYTNLFILNWTDLVKWKHKGSILLCVILTDSAFLLGGQISVSVIICTSGNNNRAPIIDSYTQFTKVLGFYSLRIEALVKSIIMESVG